MRNYSSADGLAGDDATALLVDSRGFLWVGTTTGLSRFDGKEFKTFGRPDGLPHSRVNALLEDRAGTIWVGTAAGAVRIDSDSTVMSPVDLGSESGAHVACFAQTRDGRLWLVAGRKLFVAADQSAPFRAVRLPVLDRNEPENPRFSIETLAEGRDGDLWIGTIAGLLRRLKDGRILRIAVRPTGPDDDRIKHVAVDDQGRLWITHWGLAHRPGIHFGVYVFMPPAADQPELDLRTALHPRAYSVRGSEPVSLPKRPGDVVYLTAGSPIGDARVFGALPTDDGAWLTTINGLRRLRGTRVEHFDAPQGLATVIQTAVQDRARNLWLGTAGSGVIRLGLDEFRTYGEYVGVPRGEIAGILEDGTGTLCLFGLDLQGRGWFGRVANDRIEMFDARGTSHVRYWGWGWHQVFLRDRGGGFWVATGEGLFRYPATQSCAAMSTRQPTWYRQADGLPVNDVFRIFEDSRRDLWIASARLVRWRRSTGAFERISDHPDAPSAFAEDRAGNLWIGFYHGGVARWKAGALQMFPSGREVPPGFVFTLFVDRKGRLWIGTESGGLVRVDDPGADAPAFATVTRDPDVADVPVYAMMEDRADQFYLSTARGVLRFDERRGVTRRYSLADGFTGHMARTVHSDRSGALWFGTRQGLSQLMPEPDLEAGPLPVFIDRLVVGGAPQPTSLRGSQEIEGLVVQPGSRRIEISYGSASLRPGATPTYATRLAGVDPEWSRPTAERTITYANLEPGSYRFEVRAIVDGRSSAGPAVVSFTVLPPIWQRQSVQLGAALGAVALAYLLYHLRVSRLLAMERVRSRLARDLHDDLGARLSRISILSEVAARRVSSDAPSAQHLLGEVGETAQSLLQAAADITWSVDPRQDTLGSLAARIRRFASDMLDGRDMSWNLETEAEDAAITLPPEYRRHVLLVFQEAVNNVVRHSGARRVTLRLLAANGRLVASIEDDGCGFDTGGGAGRASPGNGLDNMARRAEQLGGTLSRRSSAGMGAIVELSVPLP